MCFQKDLIQSLAYQTAFDFGSLLGLEMPIIIKVSKAQKFERGCFAIWENMSDENGNQYHQITLAMGVHWENAPELGNTIIHELIHCWQEEKGLDVDHNAEFWAFEELANKYGYTIRYPGDNYTEFLH